jgi:hypothetical protein
MHHRIAIVALLLLLLPGVARADIEDEGHLSPGDGDFELKLAGDLAHLFKSEVTGFTLELSFGYFFTDWFEAGIAGSVGYAEGGSYTASAAKPLTSTTKSHHEALTVGPVSSIADGWHGSSDVWFRFLPFDATQLPYYLDPFFNVQFGVHYGRYYPCLVLSVSIGLNIYLTDQVGLAPEFGYSMIHATDSEVRFDGSSVEHSLGAVWGLSFFW